jgi:uncharacterized protein YecT (DUF1311 family)
MGRMHCAAIGLFALLAGCNEATSIKCDSAEAQAVVSSIVKEQIAKQTRTQIGNNAEEMRNLDSSIRATLSQLNISIQDIRTTKNDPNSTKRFCEGSLSIVVPLAIIDNADKANQAFNIKLASKTIEDAGFERAADRLTHSLSYTVQPTDDGKKTFAEVENAGSIFEALGDVVSSHLLLPRIQAKEEADAVERRDRANELAVQALAQTQADLDLAGAENKIANQTIGEIWKMIPDQTRSQVLEVQRAWIAKKTADCNIKAAETSTDSSVQEIARLRCDTEMTQARSRDLRSLLPS